MSVFREEMVEGISFGSWTGRLDFHCLHHEQQQSPFATPLSSSLSITTKNERTSEYTYPFALHLPSSLSKDHGQVKMGLYVHKPNPNAFVRTMRKLYHDRLQFKKGYVGSIQRTSMTPY